VDSFSVILEWAWLQLDEMWKPTSTGKLPIHKGGSEIQADSPEAM